MKILHLLVVVLILITGNGFCPPPPPPGPNCWPPPCVELSNPADSATMSIEGLYSKTLKFIWLNKVQNVTYTYKWIVDNITGNFMSPLAILDSDNAGSDTAHTLNYSETDSILATFGIGVGLQNTYKWTVKAYSSNDTIQATPFVLTLHRGILINEFNLFTPPHYSSLNVRGKHDLEFEFTWESQDSSVQYVIYAVSGGIKLFTKNTTRNSLKMRYDSLDLIMQNILGMNIGDQTQITWHVKSAYAGDTLQAQNGPFVLNLTRGPLTKDFHLVNPFNNTIIDLTNDQINTYEFTWTNAQFNGKGNLIYRYLLDVPLGDFKNPIAVFQADSSGGKEKITLAPGVINYMLNIRGYNDSGLVFFKWMVTTDLFDTSSSSFNIIFKKAHSYLGFANIEHEEFRIIPNPMNQECTIYLSEELGKSCVIELYSIEGKLIRPVVNGNESDNVRIERGNLKPGMYFVRVTGNNFSASRRLVIE